MSFVNSEHVNSTIAFKDIEAATNKFTTEIGKGGYGPVYKGQLLICGQLTTVAIKRLQIDNLSGQGLKEFLTEIHLLSRYKHPNLVSLLGFCDEANEKALIYEYAAHGSLDKYLRNKCPLSWKQRINICIDAARGLDYLHNHVAEDHRVIHRDIKSANILLDHNWNAKIADLGLSKVGRANENDTYLITNACGTQGYCDPTYIHTGVLTKESDVYSFGVVLFEVLCGRLCFINIDSKHRFLPQLAKDCYEENKLHHIIDPDLKNYADSDSVKQLSKIAYQCLKDDRNERPSMGSVLRKLEKALKYLELEEACELQVQGALGLQIGESWMDYEVIKSIYKMRETPLACITREEIYSHIFAGILVDGGNVWFCVDKNGVNRELISAMKLMHLDGDKCRTISNTEAGSLFFSRLPKLMEVRDSSNLNQKVMIRTQFLSPETPYAAYLVLKTTVFQPELTVCLIYRVNDTKESYISYPVRHIDQFGWLMIELFQTISSNRYADFEVMIEEFYCLKGDNCYLTIEGITFLPIQKIDDDEIDNLEEMDNHPIIDSEIRLPRDYKQFLYYSSKEMMSMRRVDVIFPTEEEAYSILSKGLRIEANDEVNMWFWISKLHGKKCFMLPPKLRPNDEECLKCKLTPSNESRWEYVLDILPSDSQIVHMSFNIRENLLSGKTRYGCYLVYKIPQNLLIETPVSVELLDFNNLGVVNRVYETTIYLSVPQRPVIGPHGEMRSPNAMNKLKGINYPRKRNDGWYEVSLLNFPSYDEALEDSISAFDKGFLYGACACIPWFLVCMSDNEPLDTSTSSTTLSLNPDFPSITIKFLFVDNIQSPNLIVQGIEFRPL